MPKEKGLIGIFTRSKTKLVSVSTQVSDQVKRKMPDNLNDPNAKRQHREDSNSDPLDNLDSLERQLGMVDSQKILDEVVAMMQESGNSNEDETSVKKNLVYTLSIHISKDTRMPITIKQFEQFQSFLWKKRTSMSAEDNEKLNIEYICHHRTMGRIHINIFTHFFNRCKVVCA